MRAAIFSLRSAASFRNQSALLYKAAVGLGLEAEEKDLGERVAYPMPGWDRLVCLAPIWPRYTFDAVRLATPWFARRFTLYGPVDGPLVLNVNFFKVLENLGVTVPSQFCRESLERSGVRVQGVVPHAIDPSDFQFSQDPKYGRLQLLREQFPGRTIFFSNINPLHRKGLPELAKALEILAAKRPKDFIFILHTGRQKAMDLAPTLARTPNLVLEDAYNTLPFRHVALKTASCDVFVFPSRLEGFGLPVLEAMATRRAVVCCDMAPLNEMVGQKEAWLFPYTGVKQETWEAPGCVAQLHEYDPKALATAMEDAMDHPEESREKGLAAYQRSLQYDYMKVYGPFLKG